MISLCEREMSTPGQEEDKNPGDSSVHINLKVMDEDANEIPFRIKRNTQHKKLMNAYCRKQSVDLNSIVFLFDGCRIHGERTPDELEMEEVMRYMLCPSGLDALVHNRG